jgi:RNA polymerase sigma-70 factor (ECF subfamily)
MGMTMNLNDTDITDTDIIKQFKSGDSTLFTVLINRYYAKAYQIAYSILKQHEDTEEIVQDSFIKINKVLKDFRGDSSFKSWMTRIVANTAINRYRKNRKHREKVTSNEISPDLHSKEMGPRKECMSSEIQDNLVQCFSQVSTTYKDVLKLRFMNALSYEEIAITLDCSIGTVKSRISRGRSELRDILLQSKISYVLN